MTTDPIMAELMQAADAPQRDFDEPQPQRQREPELDTSRPVGPVRGRFPGETTPSGMPFDDAVRLKRAEDELIEAWGVLICHPGFTRVPGERLPEAVARVLSAANLKE